MTISNMIGSVALTTALSIFGTVSSSQGIDVGVDVGGVSADVSIGKSTPGSTGVSANVGIGSSTGVNANVGIGSGTPGAIDGANNTTSITSDTSAVIAGSVMNSV